MSTVRCSWAVPSLGFTKLPKRNLGSMSHLERGAWGRLDACGTPWCSAVMEKDTRGSSTIEKERKEAVPAKMLPSRRPGTVLECKTNTLCHKKGKEEVVGQG